MTTTTPLAIVTQEAIRVLYREIGIVNTVRFLNQYSAGYGNYAEEREALSGHLTMDQVIAQIRADQRQAGR